MSQTLNTIRHDYIFDSDTFATQVHLIGLGATGSKIAIELAKLGIKGELLHLWDYDKVESHNISNQLFGLQDIGKYKAEAVADIIKRDTGTEVNVHVEEVKDQTMKGIVFLLTDTMKSRREIFENSIELNPNINAVIETRMGTDSCRIYTFDPVDANECKRWSETLCGDDVAEVSSCGTSISVGPTSSWIAGSAVWQFVRLTGMAHNTISKRMTKPEFELLMWTNPFTVLSMA